MGTSPTPGIRRVLTTDESSQFRHRPPPNRFSTNLPTDPSITQLKRRRSSTFSDLSFQSAKNTFRDSTDSLILPKPSSLEKEREDEGSHWDSAPLAFALLPAFGGMLFTNGSAVITDVMLLGLAAIFLNWSVRLPWDWYHSAQSIRKTEEYNAEANLSDESEADEALSFSQTNLEEVPEEEQGQEQEFSPRRKRARRPAHESATKELYRHELLALLSCFLFPCLGAYLLHTIRAQLTRPSEGLVSNYNLTIFLLASEMRPMAHLVKLVRARTLHLQRVVSELGDNSENVVKGDVQALVRRLEDLESRNTLAEPTADPPLSNKQSAILTTEIRRSLQPDLDALNRAVRRYEKRATLQAFQTDSRLQDLESRLNDAISLAAAAANTAQHKRGFTGIVIEWAATAIVLPVQAFGVVINLPLKMAHSVFNYGKRLVLRTPKEPADKGRKNNGKYSSNGKAPERIQNGRSKKLPN